MTTKYATIPQIKNGIVIDRIPPHVANVVATLLELDARRIDYVCATHIESQKMPGGKGKINIYNISSIEELVGDDIDINLIAIVAPEATINIIKNSSVAKKINVKVPEIIPTRILKCGNLTCISRAGDPEAPDYVRALSTLIEDGIKNKGLSFRDAEKRATLELYIAREPITAALVPIPKRDDTDLLRVKCKYCDRVFGPEYIYSNIQFEVKLPKHTKD